MSGCPRLCRVPWRSIFVAPNGDIKPCSNYKGRLGSTLDGDTPQSVWNTATMKDLRERFLRGEQPPECRICWQREDAIGSSQRTQFDQDFEKLYFDEELVVEAPFEPYRMDLSFSNLCNLKCRFCAPHSSSKWYDDAAALAPESPLFVGHLRSVKQPLVRHTAAMFDDPEALRHVRMFELKGGEPFLSTDLREFLDLVADYGFARNIELRIVSNGTIAPEPFLPTLAKYKRVDISYSVDGVGDVYRYVRGDTHGLEEVEKNIRALMALENSRGTAYMTVCVYNLFDILKVRDWTRALSLKNFPTFASGLVFGPDCLNVLLWPREIREKVARELIDDGDRRVASLAKYLMTPEKDVPNRESRVRDLLSFTRLLDGRRQTSIESVLPEFSVFSTP